MFKYNKINTNEKLEPENHLLLYYYSRYKIDRDGKYDKMIFSDDLIMKYNEFIFSDNEELQEFKNLIIKDPEINRYTIQQLDKFKNEPWKVSKPIIWNAEKKSPYFIKNLQYSHRFEEYVAYIFTHYGIDIGVFYSEEDQNVGECLAGIEIKFDMESLNTDNIYIEFQEKRDASQERWVNSGILKKDNTKYFLIGTFADFLILRKEKLKLIYKSLLEGEKTYNCELKFARKGTSKGFVIPIVEARKISITIQEVVKELKNYGL